MAAITDVARLAGVSKSTASRALSGGGYVSSETRAKVEAAAEQIGYVASSNAASLVTGQTRNVGVIIPFIGRWFFGEVLEGIESRLIGAGYDLTLYRLSEREVDRQKVFDYYLVRKRVDAVVSVGVELSPSEVALLHSLGKPVVCLGGATDGIPSLSIDDVEASRLVTEHLLSLGHSRIMHFGGDQIAQMDFRTHSQRLSGFRLAMADAGIVQDDDFRIAEFTIPSGYAVAMSVLADPRSRPTAIVAACDEIAIGAIIAARQLGIQVPAQLSVVGIDDHDLAEMFGLTTLRQNPRRQGELAVGVLMSQLAASGATIDPLIAELLDAGGNASQLPVELVVRSSTTAPPA